jgi:mannose-6-phosphate isomerase-like protein (cupin superfamily)
MKKEQMSNYSNNIVKKPWGYEYLAYQNKDVALWFLYIKPEHSTSLHCHPNKTTGLILLDGQVETSFLTGVNKLNPTDKVMIRKGLFHSTKATNENGAWVFEIETPVNKQDLVRFKDNYGREGKPYEDETFEIPKAEDCLWIYEPKDGETKIYSFANCLLEVKNITDISEFNKIDSSLNVMFLKGGILAEYDQKVAGPGDIVIADTLQQLIEVFPKVDPDTIVIIFKKEING